MVHTITFGLAFLHGVRGRLERICVGWGILLRDCSSAQQLFADPVLAACRLRAELPAFHLTERFSQRIEPEVGR